MGERTGRFELKYLIGKKDYYLLKQMLPRILELDPHNLNGSRYTVISIYFDDPIDSAYYEKVDGDFERKKFRIRFYDFSDAFIKLEKKEKIGGITYKTDMRIDKSVVLTALNDPFAGPLTIVKLKSHVSTSEPLKVIGADAFTSAVMVLGSDVGGLFAA